jgi:hypothetical protein
MSEKTPNTEGAKDFLKGIRQTLDANKAGLDRDAEEKAATAAEKGLGFGIHKASNALLREVSALDDFLDDPQVRARLSADANPSAPRRRATKGAPKPTAINIFQTPKVIGLAKHIGHYIMAPSEKGGREFFADLSNPERATALLEKTRGGAALRAKAKELDLGISLVAKENGQFEFNLSLSAGGSEEESE